MKIRLRFRMTSYCILMPNLCKKVKTNQKLSLFFVCDAQITHEMQD